MAVFTITRYKGMNNWISEETTDSQKKVVYWLSNNPTFYWESDRQTDLAKWEGQCSYQNNQLLNVRKWVVLL
jgi:hypothetical protein